MTKKELLETLENLEYHMKNYNITVESAYADLYNAAMDYGYDLEDLFYDYLDEDSVNEMLKHEVENWGIQRVYHFLWDVNPMSCGLYRLNGYGNLEEAHYDDLQWIIDEIRDRVEDDEDEGEKVIEDVDWNLCTIR